ncbi:hypothetical protein AX16_008724 [Volvariella volvacea WC 439]|nr:hypothetical protein AX16_008724 [Volvariella volvacea WC 439]
MACAPSLDNVPQEVLEHIAFLAATSEFLGPPSALVPLLHTSRRIHSRLSIKSNHHLYAKIFAHKFDLVPAVRRLGGDPTSPKSLAAELQLRCYYLKRIRERSDATFDVDGDSTSEGGERLHGLLLHAYLLMLENEEKNELQLREYAHIEDWLKQYWFGVQGASLSLSSIQQNHWPPNNQETSLAMWLFWFLLRPAAYPRNDDISWVALNILKVFAIAAHRYELTTPSWVDFHPEHHSNESGFGAHYSSPCQLVVPPLTTPAILSFIALVNQLAEGDHGMPRAPSLPSAIISQDSREWESEWNRCRSLAQKAYDKYLTEAFSPGSIDGIWEGVFTYTEFTAYAQLLAGAAPPILQKSMIVRQSQRWKLREYHLIAPDPSRSDSGVELDSDNSDPLPSGDPLRSYFPHRMSFQELSCGVQIKVPGFKDPFYYRRASKPACHSGEEGKTWVQDVIIFGEGHSSWGQFSLRGRVRPCDGFVSLLKEYMDGDRGKWLYRGYLVGNVNRNLAGFQVEFIVRYGQYGETHTPDFEAWMSTFFGMALEASVLESTSKSTSLVANHKLGNAANAPAAST